MKKFPAVMTLLWVFASFGFYALGVTGAALPSGDLKSRIIAAAADQEWMLYTKNQGITRLKYFGIQNYYAPKDSDLFKLVTVDNRHYAVMKDGTILEENWENKNTFTSSFSPLKTVVAELDKKIAEQEERLKKNQHDQNRNSASIERLKQTCRSIDDRIDDVRSRRDRYSNRGETINRLNNRLKAAKRQLRQAEKTVKELKKELRKQEQELTALQKKRKLYPDSAKQEQEQEQEQKETKLQKQRKLYPDSAK
ncbi:MAG: hypothetical protein PHQ27_08045 [Victivallales bacterium]|nr:hypothetical protein [Victivallales bacterium]